MDNLQANSRDPLGEQTTPVHKRDDEGVLFINSLNGLVTQPVDERPEWAEGLTAALLIERGKFYSDRLGPRYAKEHANPEVYAFEDLGWTAIDADGEPIELEADPEFRMSVVAEVLGIDRTADLSAHAKGTGEDTAGAHEQAAVLIDLHKEYTSEEMHALEQAQAAEFDTVAQPGNGTK